MRRLRPVVGVAALLLLPLAAACTGGAPLRVASCEEQFPIDRCLRMAAVVAHNAGVDPATVTGIAIVPRPTPRQVNGQTILETLGGATPIHVRITLGDGSTRDGSLCGGIPGGPACANDPHLEAGSITSGGYRDVPCADPPDGCPTPFPSPEPAAVAAATPLSIRDLAIPIDHVGAYEAPIGDATLPHGILTEASFGFGDDWPDHVTITDGWVQLEIRSKEPDGKPFQNYYEHGWRPDPERVEAVLIFGVDAFDPGALLDIRDVHVH